MILPRYWDEADREAYEERAAIIEFDANVDRDVAEKRAYRQIETKVQARMRKTNG